jgi:acyl-coenzyme A synthetase/AMP-(fatty) acid ligase
MPAPLGSVGRPLPGFEAKITDEDGNECQRGAIGELALRGPGMFDAYLKPFTPREEGTRGGWFFTGDYAVQDSQGYITVVGRKKSVIISAGSKVFPEEVERVLNAHPAVKLSRVFGRKHDLLGESVVAEVVLEEDSFATEELFHYCRGKLSPAQMPVQVVVVNSVPTTMTGKILRV